MFGMTALRHERPFHNPALRDFYEAPGAPRRIPFGSDTRVQISDYEPPRPTFADSGRLTSSRRFGGGRRRGDRSAFSRDMQTARLGRCSRTPDIRLPLPDPPRLRPGRRTRGTAAPSYPTVW